MLWSRQRWGEVTASVASKGHLSRATLASAETGTMPPLGSRSQPDGAATRRLRGTPPTSRQTICGRRLLGETRRFHECLPRVLYSPSWSEQGLRLIEYRDSTFHNDTLNQGHKKEWLAIPLGYVRTVRVVGGIPFRSLSAHCGVRPPQALVAHAQTQLECLANERTPDAIQGPVSPPGV